MPSLPLTHNFSWSLAGNAVYSACQWGILVVLAKLVSADMVGRFTLGMAVCGPVIMFTNLQLRQVQATDATNEYGFFDYLFLRVVTTTVGLILILSLVLIAGYRGETRWIILAVGVTKALESLSDVFYGLFQKNERMDRIAASLVARGTLSLAALGIVVYATHSVFWGVVAMGATWAAILVLYDIPNGLRLLNQGPCSTVGDGSPKRAAMAGQDPGQTVRLRHLFCMALPLGVGMGLSSLMTNVPRYFVKRWCGEAQLGIFAAMSYLMVMGNTVVAALGQSATPVLARHHALGNRAEFRKLVSRLLGVALLLGLAGISAATLAGREILTILYRPQYGDYPHVFIWIMAAAGFWYVASILGYAATASRRLRLQPLALAVALLATVIACAILVPAQGILGAAIASVSTAAIVALAYFVILVSTRSDRR